MVFDFSFWLVVAAAVSGLVWAVDARLLRPRRLAAAAPGQPPPEPVLVEYARSFFPIILLVLVIRSFLFEPFRIPSDSMMPTLLDGDFIFVNKYVYGLRLPVLNTEVVAMGEPQRGDVVVFRLPMDPSTNYIKRHDRAAGRRPGRVPRRNRGRVRSVFLVSHGTYRLPR